MFNSSNNLNTIPWILKDEHLVHKKNYSIHNQCFKRGYRITKEIDGTLQGIVYEAINIKNNEKVIIKCTNCALHKQNATIHNGKLVRVKENVIIEQQILKRLEAKQPPKGTLMFLFVVCFVRNYIEYIGFVRILEIFCDGVYIFTIQEYGGKNLFDYIINCHNKIKKGILPLDEWKKHCNVLIYQCLQFIYWLHNIAKCAHLDISLENMLIKDVEYDINSKKFINHGHINFIDFGLALFLSKNKTFCHKFVGKIGYKSKEIYDHKPFDPRKSDIWSVGVCLFMMYVIIYNH